MHQLSTLSIVIPALNEQENIPQTVRAIPIDRLREMGIGVEVLVVDNGSSDRTAQVARSSGAKVIVQPVRGYGNAYKVGFANCVGDVIATGDADLTYPFSMLPDALGLLHRQGLDFLSTDRLGCLTPGSMSTSHKWANHALSLMCRMLFQAPFNDSQSGMWIFRRQVLDGLQMRAGGMAFSQELKLEVFRNGYRCGEVPIDYLPRGGQTKMRGLRDGSMVAFHMLAHRLRARRGLPEMPHIPDLNAAGAGPEGKLPTAWSREAGDGVKCVS
ncbi:glycosyltransferase family 2 protein [Paractinoplanes globisporus]|jgi:glycosyltransferase involved in cell wall biosynthesis|uniref:Glycosyltransferase family 2 protein n=1 Tax=Paractinoplanes globisporus TaxID=113565 RepID=A0ABW6WDW4_9ACTN|nr:glycosyltransferase family 2 protein [Actinoplanes globisporus]